MVWAVATKIEKEWDLLCCVRWLCQERKGEEMGVLLVRAEGAVIWWCALRAIMYLTEKLGDGHFWLVHLFQKSRGPIIEVLV